jgi:hypothetical protein
MEATTYPLVDILKPERRFIVPTFQRDYEWTKDGQWKLLFEDLEAAAERLRQRRAFAEAAGIPVATEEKKVAPHFLGAIVCDNMPFPTGGIALRAVIDGQQRLTTVQLLARGLLDVLIERDSNRAGSVRRMLRNPEDVVTAPEEIHKLWPRRKDRDVWPTAMSDDVPAYAGSADHLYLQARRFFADSTREACADISGAFNPVRLDAMVDAVMGLFKLVVIDLDDNDDAQVIFEVLNGRQTALSAIDLVKNLLFMRGELDSADVDTLYDTYWAQFDDPWWKQTVGTGHAQRGRRDVLLSVWLTAITGEEAQVNHLYRQVRAYLDDNRPKTEAVLIELDSYASAYRAIYAQKHVSSGVLRRSYERINALRNLTSVPLLAWLQTLPEAQLSLTEHERAVQGVESWTLRRMVCGWQTRGYNTAFVRVLKEAQSAARKGDSIADAIIEALDTGGLDWPSDTQVEEACTQQRYYNNLTQERIRSILAAVDIQLREDNPKLVPAQVAYDGLQIEHVMPQSWQTHWPLPITPKHPGDPAFELAAQARQRAVDRLGNLTLVTATFNQDVSNKAWVVKRPEIAGQSILPINSDIPTWDTWDEESIETRGRSLAEVLCRVWPAADALRARAVQSDAEE